MSPSRALLRSVPASLAARTKISTNTAPSTDLCCLDARKHSQVTDRDLLLEYSGVWNSEPRNWGKRSA
uniref:Uncharacterized protein n=1 Tax=Mycena chlorophos TaxID=658473 RepID=A0ABQ0M3P7_MYCCL|nr:predicted protein [Mycena chlorophos]